MQFDNQKTRNVADVVANILAGESAKQEPQMLDEELVGNQHKIDANKNKKIDAHDFKLLRAQKDKEKANSQKFGKDVKEETEQIDELSKDSYKNYLSTSKKLVGDHAKGSQLSRYGEYGAKDRELNTKNAQKHAMKKLKEEETEQIVELSKSTLASYAKKAAGSSSTASKIASRSASLSGHESKPMLDIVSKRTLGIKKAVNRLAKEEVEELDEAMFPGTKEYEKKYGQSPQQKLRKKGDTVPTSQGEMKKTEKGVMHTRRFSEMVSAYQEQGLKFVASLVKEEPTQDEYEAELEDHKAKAEGKKKQPEVSKGHTQAVKQEETEIAVIDADKMNGVQIDTIEEREMTDAEMKKREDIVKGMKKGMAGFKQRYGERAKSVMYATATKQAMKEEKEDHYQKGYDHVRDPIADEPYLDNARERFNELKKQNPHKKGTQEHKDWHSGASAAYEEHKDMLRGN